jgi:hypothetical protein
VVGRGECLTQVQRISCYVTRSMMRKSSWKIVIIAAGGRREDDLLSVG